MDPLNARTKANKPPALLLVASTIVGLGLLSLAAITAVVQAQSWPTPPPGPPFPIPDGLETNAPVRSPDLSPGAQVFVVRPTWPGFAPLVAPIPGETFTFPGADGAGLTFRMETGTYVETVQVAVSSFVPASANDSPSELIHLGGKEFISGFSFAVLDKNGAPVVTPPRRPILVTVPVHTLVARGIDPERLVFVSFDGAGDAANPLLLPTQYRRAEGVIQTRLTEFQAIGIVHDAQ